MPKFTFSNSVDIIARLQDALDHFPRSSGEHGGEFTFCEFSTYLVCPPENTDNRLYLPLAPSRVDTTAAINRGSEYEITGRFDVS